MKKIYILSFILVMILFLLISAGICKPVPILNPISGEVRQYNIKVKSVRDGNIRGKPYKVELVYKGDLKLKCLSMDKDSGRIRYQLEGSVTLEKHNMGLPWISVSGKNKKEVRVKYEIASTREGDIDIEEEKNIKEIDMVKKSIKELVIPGLILYRKKDKNWWDTRNQDTNPEIVVMEIGTSSKKKGRRSILLDKPSSEYYKMKYNVLFKERKYYILGIDRYVFKDKSDKKGLSLYMDKKLWCECDKNTGEVKRLVFEFNWRMSGMSKEINRKDILLVNMNKTEYPGFINKWFENELKKYKEK